MVDKEEDITERLLDEAVEVTKKEKAIKEKEATEKEATQLKTRSEKEKKKSENIASETPQDRFRRIVRDQGYNIGIENMTSVFYEGNTDNPLWLDDVLKLSHIPAKNREMIITAYYGKPIKDLGITVEPGFGGKTSEEKKLEDAKKLSISDDEYDILRLSQDEMKETIKNEKTLLSIAQLKKMRKQLENDDEKKQEQHQQQYQMRQVIRPLIKDGKIIYDKNNVVVTETVVEPVSLNNQGGNSEIMNMLAIKALNPPETPKQTTGDPALLDYIKKLDSKIESMEASRQIQAKEEEIKRINDRMERKEEEYKKDMERKEREFAERLDKMNEERVRDLNELKERFSETIQHKKELDDVIGQISSSHKKEIDGLKQKVEHAQTNIERTIVSKSTDTVDKLTGKVGDIAESVIKPMADVMRDHYKTVIDQTRVNAGLPSLRDTVPKISDSELERFAKGE